MQNKNQISLQIYRMLNIFPYEYSRFEVPEELINQFFSEFTLNEFRSIKNQIIQNEFLTNTQKENCESLESLVMINYSQEIVVTNLFSSSLARQFMLCKTLKKSLIFALPFRWQQMFILNGVKVNQFMSTFVYFLDRLNFSVKCVLAYAKNSYRNLLNFKNRENSNKKAVYFHWTDSSNFHDSNLGKEYTLSRWYLINYLDCYELSEASTMQDNKFEIINTSPNLNYKPFDEFKILVKVCGELFKLIPRFNFNFALLANSFYEIGDVIRANFRLNNYSHVIFNGSSRIKKPIWAHLLEKQGVTVDFIMYSSDAEPNHSNGAESHNDIWKLSTWQKIIAYDNFQALSLRKLTNKSIIENKVKEIPWWTDHEFDLNELKKSKKSLIIFDNSFSKKFLSDSILSEYNYNTHSIQNDFLDLILEQAMLKNFYIIHKLKRNKGGYENLDYLNKIENYKKIYNNFISLFNPVSPVKLALNASHCIGIPLSSAVIQAAQHCSNTVFFDASKKISRTDSNFRGISILSSKSELDNWLTRA